MKFYKFYHIDPKGGPSEQAVREDQIVRVELHNFKTPTSIPPTYLAYDAIGNKYDSAKASEEAREYLRAIWDKAI